MTPTAALILKIFAAILFGGAVALMAFAAWTLVERTREARNRRREPTSLRRAEMRQQALTESPLFRLALPWITLVTATTEKLGLEPLRQYVHEPYARAGYPGGLDDDELVALGAILSIMFTVVAGFVAVSLLGFGFAWVALLGLPLGFGAVVAHLKSRAKEREVAIMRALPYALDLLVLMLRSGTSLRISLGRVIEDYQGGGVGGGVAHPIAVEFGQVIAEIDVGAPRTEAFKKMATRLKIADVTSLVDAIVQSEELGWPLAETLERLSDRIHAERVLRAQATAGAAGVLVMLPSTLVLLSAVLLLFAPFIVLYLVTGSIAGN